MNSFSDDKDPDNGIEIFQRINVLKLKAGGGLKDAPGQLAPQSVKNADTVVTSMATLYPKEIENILNVLNTEWETVKTMPDTADKAALAEKISNTANQIKDLAETFGYSLMAHFGTSLRDYILKTDLSCKEHFIIGQAHINVMWVAFRKNLKDDDGGAVAEELKEMVRTAIEKYS